MKFKIETLYIVLMTSHMYNNSFLRIITKSAWKWKSPLVYFYFLKFKSSLHLIIWKMPNWWRFIVSVQRAEASFVKKESCAPKELSIFTCAKRFLYKIKSHYSKLLPASNENRVHHFLQHVWHRSRRPQLKWIARGPLRWRRSSVQTLQSQLQTNLLMFCLWRRYWYAQSNRLSFHHILPRLLGWVCESVTE